MNIALAPVGDGRLIRSSPTVSRWERGLLQVVIISWVYAIYDELRAAASGTVASGLAHARQIVSVERATGLNIEHAVQQATLHLPWLVGLCNVCYSATHLAGPPIVLVLLYLRAPERYRRWRNVFLVMLGLSLLSFWLYPLLPPRLVPGGPHLTDTSASYFNVDRFPGAGVVTAATRSSAPQISPFTNPMAATPSLHVGWAVWAALAVWPVLRRRWTRWLVALYPLAMIASVVVTGNHWLLDVVGGFAVVAAAYALTHALGTIKRGHVAAAPAVDQAVGSAARRISA